MAKTDIKRSFFARRAKKGLGLGRSPPQELEEGPCSGPHLLALGIHDSTRALQSSPFQNPGGYPERYKERTDRGQTEILVSNIGFFWFG